MSGASFAIIIPARYASTRFPGKPLVSLKGARGAAKTLIQRSWECASQVPDCVGVWVATDDDRIAAEVVRFGGKVVMTSSQCANGTERCADAVEQLGAVAEIIVNLQGDAPLSPPFVVEHLVARLIANPDVEMATPAVRCSTAVYQHLVTDAHEGRIGGTTVVFNRDERALYFSKRIIPFLPLIGHGGEDMPVHLHLGMYAYRSAALARYRATPPSTLEQFEGLEQLRFLEHGLTITIVPVDELGWSSIELNNPSDVSEIERVLAERGID
jgi:3-deoxy-manno-octulosonate cytidylyltransferase (CMP-KDO synthetase)